MNITITGNLGSGKSSICKELKQMGYEVITAGQVFRKIAEERGMSVIELNKLAETDDSIDALIDNYIKHLGETRDNLVFDSRLAWHFVPNSFKVFVLTDTYEAARRVFNDKSRTAEGYSSVKDAVDGLTTRAKYERTRFKKAYGIDYFDRNNYNLIIESTDVTPNHLASEILRQAELYSVAKFNSKLLLNIRTLYPVQHFRDFDFEAFNWHLQNIPTNSYCITEKSIVMEKKGYRYIVDDLYHVFAGIRSGLDFCEVNYIHKEDSYTNIPMDVVTKELYDFEEIGNFKYHEYPDISKPKQSFLMNLYTRSAINILNNIEI